MVMKHRKLPEVRERARKTKQQIGIHAHGESTERDELLGVGSIDAASVAALEEKRTRARTD
jgi:hypothetical protein